MEHSTHYRRGSEAANGKQDVDCVQEASAMIIDSAAMSARPAERSYNSASVSDTANTPQMSARRLHTEAELQTPTQAAIANIVDHNILPSEIITRIWNGVPVCLHSSESGQLLLNSPIDPPHNGRKHPRLNISALVDDIQVRHDLNFGQPAVGPASFGDASAEKLLWKRYSDAVALDLAFYLRPRHANICCSCISSRWTGAPGPNDVRLAGFFKIIRRTLQALIRTEHWLIVDQAIDTELLLIQLRSGNCDLLSLIVWLGGILKESCSPLRDADVDMTTNLFTTAVPNRNGDKLSIAISRLFDVLQTMKMVNT